MQICVVMKSLAHWIGFVTNTYMYVTVTDRITKSAESHTKSKENLKRLKTNIFKLNSALENHNHGMFGIITKKRIISEKLFSNMLLSTHFEVPGHTIYELSFYKCYNNCGWNKKTTTKLDGGYAYFCHQHTAWKKGFTTAIKITLAINWKQEHYFYIMIGLLHMCFRQRFLKDFHEVTHKYLFFPPFGL